jgi:ABC-type Fe3+/spermidine/putrescine transport system ATPase subunit
VNEIDTLTKIGGIKGLLSRKPHELSGGEQQRVALLRALAPQPKILLLDEPLSNLDSRIREQLAFYIRQVQKKFNTTTFLVTHDIEEVKMLADQIIILIDGKIYQKGNVMEITRNPETLEVAEAVGLKNLINIQFLTPHKDYLSLKTSIGDFDIQIQPPDLKPRKLYINPTKITIQRYSNHYQDTSDSNTKYGEIISLYPDSLFQQNIGIVLINTTKDNPIQSSVINEGIRVCLTSDQEFKPGDKVMMTFDMKAFKVF